MFKLTISSSSSTSGSGANLQWNSWGKREETEKRGETWGQVDPKQSKDRESASRSPVWLSGMWDLLLEFRVCLEQWKSWWMALGLVATYIQVHVVLFYHYKPRENYKGLNDVSESVWKILGISFSHSTRLQLRCCLTTGHGFLTVCEKRSASLHPPEQ